MTNNKNDTERLLECVTCPYFEMCNEIINEPEDYPNGSCKTKDILKDFIFNTSL